MKVSDDVLAASKKLREQLERSLEITPAAGRAMGDPRMIIENAIITSAELSTKDHGVLSSWLSLAYEGGGQGFGGYNIGSNNPPHNYAGIWITRCLEIADVESWERLPGRAIRVRKDSWNGPIIAIGHIIKDDWFTPGIDLKA